MYHYNISFPLALQDMSAYVKKVNFKLHDSYANANRTLTKPPYEVTETGWGEFEIVIKIYFQDPSERPVTIYHILKLFQTGEIILQCCGWGQFTKKSKKPTQKRPPFSIITNLKPT